MQRNLTHHPGDVSVSDRERLLGQRGCVAWMTGLSGSGKSTIARALESRLFSAGKLVYVLDGDTLRQGLNSDLGFSEEQRNENIRRAGEVATLLAEAGLIVVAAFISPYRADRQRVRERAGAHRFLEIFVDVPLEDCEQRDPKGLYRRARAGFIEEFTGVTAPYEPPEAPELVLSAKGLSVEECVDRIYRCLEARGFLEAPHAGKTEPES